jgi:hypothetical protein
LKNQEEDMAAKAELPAMKAATAITMNHADAMAAKRKKKKMTAITIAMRISKMSMKITMTRITGAEKKKIMMSMKPGAGSLAVKEAGAVLPQWMKANSVEFHPGEAEHLMEATEVGILLLHAAARAAAGVAVKMDAVPLLQERMGATGAARMDAAAVLHAGEAREADAVSHPCLVQK